MTVVCYEMFIILVVLFFAINGARDSTNHSASVVAIQKIAAINPVTITEKLKNIFFYGGSPGGPGPGSGGGDGMGPGGSGGPPLGYGGWGGYHAGGFGIGPYGGPGYFGPYGGPGSGGYGQFSPYYGPNGYGPGGGKTGAPRRTPKRAKRKPLDAMIEWSQYFHNVNSRALALLLCILEIIGLILFCIFLIWLIVII